MRSNHIHDKNKTKKRFKTINMSRLDDFYNSNEPIKVLIRNHMNSEYDICEYARISYGKGEFKTEEDDKRLINYLVKHNHLAPFEHGKLTIFISAPLAIIRQLTRYRSACFSELSLRYRKAEDDFYVPDDISLREKEILRKHYEISINNYQRLSEMGVSKERARLILPLGIISTVIMTIDLRNLMHLIMERTSSKAQSEIQIVASNIEDSIKELYPNVVESYKKHIKSNYER